MPHNSNEGNRWTPGARLVIDAWTVKPGGSRGGGALALLRYLATRLDQAHVPFSVLCSPATAGALCLPPRSRIGLGEACRALLDPDRGRVTWFSLRSLPPPVQGRHVRSLTYFHVQGPITALSPFMERNWRSILRTAALRVTVANSDMVIVQSAWVAEQFCRDYSWPRERTRVVPFYDAASILAHLREDDRGAASLPLSFIYASSCRPHKNHGRLLEAWCILKAQGIEPNLLLTLSDVRGDPDRAPLLQTIEANGLNITVLPWLPYAELMKRTAACDYAVFPSLAETLGLGLIEGALLTRGVVASDRPFVHAAIEPIAVFDPLDPRSIAAAVMHVAETRPVGGSVRLASRIDTLVDLLTADR